MSASRVSALATIELRAVASRDTWFEEENAPRNSCLKRRFSCGGLNKKQAL